MALTPFWCFLAIVMFWCLTRCRSLKCRRASKQASDNNEWKRTFFLKCANPGLFFIYFRLFKHTLQFLQQINVKKYPSSIRYWDSNPRPFGRESPSITTRPGLPPYENERLKTKNCRKGGAITGDGGGGCRHLLVIADCDPHFLLPYTNALPTFKSMFIPLTISL